MHKSPNISINQTFRLVVSLNVFSSLSVFFFFSFLLIESSPACPFHIYTYQSLLGNNIQVIAASAAVQVGADEAPTRRRDGGRARSSPQSCILQRGLGPLCIFPIQKATLPSRPLGQIPASVILDTRKGSQIRSASGGMPESKVADVSPVVGSSNFHKPDVPEQVSVWMNCFPLGVLYGEI